MIPNNNDFPHFPEDDIVPLNDGNPNVPVDSDDEHDRPDDDDDVVEAEIIDINDNPATGVRAPDDDGAGDAAPEGAPEPLRPEDLASATHPETARTKKAINDTVETHTPLVEVAERRVGSSRARVVGVRKAVDNQIPISNQAAETLGQAQGAAHEARKDPDRFATRNASTRATALAIVAVGVFGFVIDRVQLRSVFSLERLGLITLIAAVLGIVQATSAHSTGEAQSDYHFAPKTSLTNDEWKTFRTWRNVGLITGIGSNVVLGVLRAAFGGGILIAALFTAGGIILWVFGFVMSYRHRAPRESDLSRATKEYKDKSAVTATTLKDLEKVEQGLCADVEAWRSSADAGVAGVDNEVVHLHARLAAHGLRWYTPPLPRTYFTWKKIANGTYNDARPLPFWKPPFIVDPNRRFTEPKPSPPRELGPGKPPVSQ